MTQMTIDDVIAAQWPEDIFHEATNAEDLKHIFKELSKVVHPDINPGIALSTDAFSKLRHMYELAVKKMKVGVFGKSNYITVIQAKHKLSLMSELKTSIFAQNYLSLIDTDPPKRGVVSISLNTKLNRFMLNDYNTSVYLRDHDKGYHSYIPEVMDIFTYIINGESHSATVCDYDPDVYITLEQLHQAYPDGLDPKDASWIYRQLLDVIGYAHSCGMLHGAVIPSNILVGLGEAHQVKLINWHCKVALYSDDLKIKVISTDYTDMYPPEIKKREKPTFSVDLYMAAKSMEYIIGKQQIPPINAFLSSFYPGSVNSRPNGAWQVRKEYTKLIEKIWGERKFRPLTLPESSK